MKKKIFISMFGMHLGGAERSLIGLLESIDYNKFKVDLFLYSHEGELMEYIPNKVNLLPAIKEYETFGKPIKQVMKEGNLALGTTRILARFQAKRKNKSLKHEQGTYKQMQYMWHYAMPFLPKVEKEYDVAIGFLGPHNFIINKVNAKKKVGWVHTDYYTVVNPDVALDLKMWSQLDYIAHVSKDCETSFLKVFPQLKEKTIVIENILSSSFVKQQSKEKISDMDISDKLIKICSVGRFSNQKGFDMAVLACKQLVEEGYNIQWYIIGYGSEESIIRRLVQDHHLESNFILLGKKINPYPYIAACDIYCQPSRYEGKAVTVREAQMLNKPVVITNYPTATSQLTDGVDGHICNLSVEGIAEGIKTIIHNKELKDTLVCNTSKQNYGNEQEVQKIYQLI